MPAMSLSIRDVDVQDLNFIFSSWKRSLYYTKPYRYIDPSTYHRCHGQLIERILNSPNVQIKVACLEDDPNIIVGYSVFQPKTLHWIYVKEDWRRQRIADKLYPQGVQFCSHMTATFHIIRSANPRYWVVFNPYETQDNETLEEQSKQENA